MLWRWDLFKVVSCFSRELGLGFGFSFFLWGEFFLDVYFLDCEFVLLVGDLGFRF